MKSLPNFILSGLYLHSSLQPCSLSPCCHAVLGSSDTSHYEAFVLSIEEVPEDHDFQHFSWVSLFFFSLFFNFMLFPPSVFSWDHLQNWPYYYLLPAREFSGICCFFLAKIEVGIHWCVWVYQTDLGGLSDSSHTKSQMAHFFQF